MTTPDRSTSSAPSRSSVSAGSRRPHRASNGVSATTISGLWNGSRYRRFAASWGTPRLSSSANPASACSAFGCTCKRQRLRRREHLEQVGQPLAEGRLDVRTDQTARVRGDRVVEARAVGKQRRRVGMSTEPELGLGFTVVRDAEQVGDRGGAAPRVRPDRVGEPQHRGVLFADAWTRPAAAYPSVEPAEVGAQEGELLDLVELLPTLVVVVWVDPHLLGPGVGVVRGVDRRGRAGHVHQRDRHQRGCTGESAEHGHVEVGKGLEDLVDLVPVDREVAT